MSKLLLGFLTFLRHGAPCVLHVTSRTLHGFAGGKCKKGEKG